MARPSTYGRRASRRKKDRWLRGYIVWPMPEQKALQTFSSSAEKVRAMVKLKTGHEPEAFGWNVVPAEVAIRIYSKRTLMNQDHKLKEPKPVSSLK